MHLNIDLIVWWFKQENLMGDGEALTWRDLHNMSTCLINSHPATGIIELECWNQDH